MCGRLGTGMRTNPCWMGNGSETWISYIIARFEAFNKQQLQTDSPLRARPDVSLTCLARKDSVLQWGWVDLWLKRRHKSASSRDLHPLTDIADWRSSCECRSRSRLIEDAGKKLTNSDIMIIDDEGWNFQSPLFYSCSKSNLTIHN